MPSRSLVAIAATVCFGAAGLQGVAVASAAADSHFTGYSPAWHRGCIALRDRSADYLVLQFFNPAAPRQNMKPRILLKAAGQPWYREPRAGPWPLTVKFRGPSTIIVAGDPTELVAHKVSRARWNNKCT